MKKAIISIIGFLVFSFSPAQDLEMLINTALENSPEIQKFELQNKILIEKVNEVNTVPNTEVGVGYFVSEPETRTGAQRLKVSAKQMIPWFGSITARENYVSSIAEAQYEDIVIHKRKLVVSVTQSYYNIYAIKAKQKVLSENIELLETFETLALTSVEVGKASAVDVLRLQIRQNELEQRKQVLEQDYLAEQTRFNKLLNRDKLMAITLVNELSIPDNDDPIINQNIELHPELIKYDKVLKSVEQSELLNQKESNPMLGFGLDYIAVSERPEMSFKDNGKDIIMPMLSLSIPIFNNKFKSRSLQNELKEQEIKYQRQDRLNKLITALDKAITKRTAARISYITHSQNLEQAKNAEDILIKNYETGTIDFIDVLDIQELQLKFQINQIQSIRDFYMQSALINYLSN